MSDFSGDYITARKKINEGTDWRGSANVPIDGDATELGFRLLSESEFLELKRIIPLSELQEYQDEDQTESEQRLQELQEKDELTDEEVRELENLQAKLATMQDKIEDALGKDAYDKIMWAGKKAIMPTEADVEDYLGADPELQCRIAGVGSVAELPNPLTFDDAEEILKRDMVETVSHQPYPIKFTLGMQAFMETVRVLGNGLRRGEQG